MNGVHPFNISIPASQLDGLIQRLKLSRLPDEPEGTTSKYGAPLGDITRLVNYWRDQYDWRKHELELNKLPHFRTQISVGGFPDLEIHFIHQTSQVTDAIPLLFLHGWPGSFLEVTKLLPLLTAADSAPSFHVVAPSLPNFGFSGGVKKVAFGLREYAETCHELMIRLGYPKYATQGGDWGMMISRVIGILFPDACKASHVNMPLCSHPKFTSQPLVYLKHAISSPSARDTAAERRKAWFVNEGSGYSKVHATKPQTLGYSLADSPVGLLSWIYEKLIDWTDNYKWSDDEILTWISIYWFSTAGPAASVRIYYEASHAPDLNRSRVAEWVPTVKLGIANFPAELQPFPRGWLDTMGPVVHVSEFDKGGHFAAWECPEALAGDLRKMFGKGGGAYEAIAGMTGYGDG
ncbi:MAG: hypothetical protein M1814_003942 [Vezdaea aestivalis]|nr:MAG: hypothetical protein M1814_003942 [Vezdaea aestivalis]